MYRIRKNVVTEAAMKEVSSSESILKVYSVELAGLAAHGVAKELRFVSYDVRSRIEQTLPWPATT
jgi:hypothetical protein